MQRGAAVLLPDDPEERKKCFRNALRNWRFAGYVLFNDRSQDWLQAQLPDYAVRDLARELHLFVEGGGEIDEQKERRPEWDDHDFHFDLRVPIRGRRLYFETLLFCNNPNDPDDPFISVVNVHDV